VLPKSIDSVTVDHTFQRLGVQLMFLNSQLS